MCEPIRNCRVLRRGTQVGRHICFSMGFDSTSPLYRQDCFLCDPFGTSLYSLTSDMLLGSLGNIRQLFRLWVALVK